MTWGCHYNYKCCSVYRAINEHRRVGYDVPASSLFFSGRLGQGGIFVPVWPGPFRALPWCGKALLPGPLSLLAENLQSVYLPPMLTPCTETLPLDV